MIKGTVLPLLYAGVAVFVGVCAVLYLFQERLVFMRQPLADDARRALRALPGTAELEVTAGDGARLHGWLRHGVENAAGMEKTASRGLVLYFGGNAEEVSGQMFDAARLAPWSVAAFNYRGYGLSEGRPTEAAIVADALTIYDRLAARGDVDPERIVVLGRSLGSGVAVQVAASRPVRAVVLVSPFDSLRSLGRRQYPFLPVSLLLKHPFDSAARAPRIRAPVLVFAGGRDMLVPASLSQRLHDAWGGPKRWIFIPEADHNDIQARPRYWPAIREFLASLAPARLDSPNDLPTP